MKHLKAKKQKRKKQEKLKARPELQSLLSLFKMHGGVK